MTCKNCGAQLEDGAKFCAGCGTSVDAQELVDNIMPAELTPAADSIEPVEPVVAAEPVEQQSVVTPAEQQPVVAPVEPVVTPVEPVAPVQPVPTVEQPVVNNNSSIESSDEKPKKSFVGPIIGIIALLLIAGGIYFYFFNNKNKVVKDLINNAYDKLEGLSITNSVDLDNQSVLINGDLTITTNIPGLEDLSGEKFKYTLGTDYANKKMEFGFALDESGKNVFDVAIYLLNNSGYLSLKDDFDKLLRFDVDEFEEIFSSAAVGSISESDIKYVTKAYRDILIDSLKGNDFDKSSATIVLDGKDTKVTKLTYNLTSEKAAKLANNIIDGTLKDSKLLEILSKMTGSSVDELKSELEMSKVDDTYVDDSELVTFDIYTKGFNNTFVGMDIQGIIQIRKNSDNVTIEAGMGTEKITLTIKKVSDENVVIELNSTIEGAEFSGSLSISYKEVSANNYAGSIVFKLSYQGSELNITSNFTEVVGATVADVDVTGAVDFDSLTAEDEKKISDNLEKKIMGSKFYEIIEGLSSAYSNYSSYNSSYDLDYDFDYDFDYDL